MLERRPVSRSLLSRSLALALCLTTLGLPAGSALLDASEPGESVHVESSHDADRCAYRHDHRACLLLGTTGLPTSASSWVRPAPDLAGSERVMRYPAPFRAFLGSPLPPRGPPPHLG